MRKTPKTKKNKCIRLMDNIFVVAGLMSVVFLIFKFVEMRFVEKESRPFKLLVRDAILVYLSIILGNYLVEQINPMLSGGNGSRQTIPAFTDNPGF